MWAAVSHEFIVFVSLLLHVCIYVFRGALYGVGADMVEAEARTRPGAEVKKDFQRPVEQAEEFESFG